MLVPPPFLTAGCYISYPSCIIGHSKPSGLKTANIYYLTISLNQESWSSLTGWSRLKACHEVVVKMTTGGVVIWKLDRGWRIHFPKWFTHRAVGNGLSSLLEVDKRPQLSPHRPLHRGGEFTSSSHVVKTLKTQAAWVSSQYVSCFTPQWSKKGQERSHGVFHYIVSEVRHFYFWHILFIRSDSLIQPTLKKRIFRLHHLKGRISQNWWMYPKATTMGYVDHVL